MTIKSTIAAAIVGCGNGHGYGTTDSCNNQQIPVTNNRCIKWRNGQFKDKNLDKIILYAFREPTVILTKTTKKNNKRGVVNAQRKTCKTASKQKSTFRKKG